MDEAEERVKHEMYYVYKHGINEMKRRMVDRKSRDKKSPHAAME